MGVMAKYTSAKSDLARQIIADTREINEQRRVGGEQANRLADIALRDLAGFKDKAERQIETERADGIKQAMLSKQFLQEQANDVETEAQKQLEADRRTDVRASYKEGLESSKLRLQRLSQQPPLFP